MHYLIYIFLLIINPIISQGTISYSTGTSHDYSLPINGLYDYSVSSCIFLQSEIGSGTKDISSVRFEIKWYDNPYTLNDQKMYMAHTSAYLS
jgi:hypothetical protein